MKLKNQGQKKSHFLYKLRLAIPTYLSKRIAVPAKYLNFGGTARSLFSLKGYIYFFAEFLLFLLRNIMLCQRLGRHPIQGYQILNILDRGQNLQNG